MQPDSAPNSRSDVRRRLPLAAFVLVVVALIALALTPAVVLERVSAVGRELTTTSLPVYDRLRHLALTMEQQSSAVRGFLLSGDARYRAQLEEARAAELEALQDLGRLAPRIGPTSYEHFEALQRLSARRYAQNAGLMEAEGGVETYRAALPALELLRDSVLVRLAALEEEVVRVTTERAEEEASWAGRQRWISLSLGILALLAALLVGWFAARQRRLTAELERALAESNRLRAQSERRREELERVTESRARLMRGFSHDVKNPLGAAHGYLQLLGDGIMGPLSQKQVRSVERAGRSITAALNLVEDLLELARAESGKLEVALVPTSVREVVEDAAEEYRAQAEAKGLTMSLHVPASAPVIITDGQRVRQVLGNLISNAVKYTPAGGVTIRLDPAADGEAAGVRDGLAIRVSDTGPGIPSQQRHLLFEEFVRLDPAAGRGAGVGLTISHRIARALGGEISVESAVGKGSTFTLWLPRQTPPRPAVQNTPQVAERASS